MNRAFRGRLLIFALSLGIVCGSWNRAVAQTEPTTGFSTGTAQNVGEFTLTLQRKLASKIITRLEFRRDMSDQDVFPYRTGLLKDAQNTVTLGMVYAFSSADAKERLLRRAT
jgi:hypothetical protein